LLAAKAGADAIGLVFYAKSPRAVDIRRAREIVEALPPFVTVVGLFVDASRCEVEDTLDAVALDVLQFHGDEEPADCARFHRPWFKALRVAPGFDIGAAAARYAAAGASALLLDTYVAGVARGVRERVLTGRLIPDVFRPKPLILAGGLTCDNVADAIAQVHPYAVDVSGGVELSKGIKSAEKVRAFIQRVRSVM